MATIDILKHQLLKYDDLMPNTSFLHDYLSSGDTVDMSRKFKRDANGTITFNFGKHKGKIYFEKAEITFMMNPLEQPEQRKKVWIIDDEVDLCLLMKAYFLRKNYLVYISHTVAEAFSRMGAEKPDFVLLDGSLCKDPVKTKAEIEQLVPGVNVFISGSDRSFKLTDYF